MEKWKISLLDRKMRDQRGLMDSGARAYCSLVKGSMLEEGDVDAIIAAMKTTFPSSTYWAGNVQRFVFWWSCSGYPSAHSEEDLRRLLARELG